MRITSFRIENFRNLKLAESTNPPDFMVICGGNGSGKSALLNALMTAKEHAGSYGNFAFDARVVSADAARASISLQLAFNENERTFVEKQWGTPCPELDEVVIEIKQGGSASALKRSKSTTRLLSYYAKSFLGSPGFFDYIDAHRPVPKTQLSTWDASFLSDDRAKGTLGAAGTAKFQNTKAYLAGLVMQDIQHAQAAHRAGQSEFPDSLKPIREFFDSFFAPMRFVDVLIHKSPFEFIIETPRGVIDLDDLSSGEKEILNTFVRFHQLSPRGAVILFDEADAHLHPDLERRYLQVLRDIGQGNQLWLTTHSPEMMIAAGSDSLYTVLKTPQPNIGNQFLRVTSNQELHSALSEVMGSRGLVSFNQRIVFIEGEESSADREVYEKLYPPGAYNVSFIPAGNSATVRKTAERVNELLSASIEFQHYYSIIDEDIDRSIPAPVPAGANRLFQLPVYHVENFLLIDEVILAAGKDLLSSSCAYASLADVEAELKRLVESPQHIKPYAKAMLDARLAKAAKEAYDSVFQQNKPATSTVATFAQTEADAIAAMKSAVADGSWRQKCKGRDVLKAFCATNGFNYEHFRNLLISKLSKPPEPLAKIMDQILA
jgi:predicted ATPase